MQKQLPAFPEITVIFFITHLALSKVAFQQIGIQHFWMCDPFKVVQDLKTERVFENQRFPCLAAITATVASISIYFSLRRGDCISKPLWSICSINFLSLTKCSFIPLYSKLKLLV